MQENKIEIGHDITATDTYFIVTALLDKLGIKYKESGEETITIKYWIERKKFFLKSLLNFIQYIMKEKDKIEIILRHFRNDVFDGQETELCYDEELFMKWLEEHWYLIEDK
jgi:hypothetical protein